MAAIQGLKPPGRGSRGAAMLAAITASSVASLAHRARHADPYQPELEHIALDLPSPIQDHIPLRIGFVTDTHVGPAIRAADIDRALALLFAEKPDLLLLGGDYVCESPRYIPEAAAVLGHYAKAAPLGAIGVLGNHDYSNDAPRIVSAFEKHGIQLLRNESIRVALEQGSLWLVGIDDAILAHPDPTAAFAGIPGEADPIALWHEPDWADESARLGACLQLSGHSHGGQVRLPLLGPLAAPPGGRKFVQGMHVVHGMPVYTSRGVGVYRPQVRFRCAPEVTLLTLA